ncbi:hypothetical protein AB0N06_25780 [Streptomyces sp. NPDC051020]|uniref:hypothetical protein n=1 Tax=Streptomyces sp. NPDC051020 TaxID=3155409 RepID=UPI00342BEC89
MSTTTGRRLGAAALLSAVVLGGASSPAQARVHDTHPPRNPGCVVTTEESQAAPDSQTGQLSSRGVLAQFKAAVANLEQRYLGPTLTKSQRNATASRIRTLTGQLAMTRPPAERHVLQAEIDAAAAQLTGKRLTAPERNELESKLAELHDQFLTAKLRNKDRMQLSKALARIETNLRRAGPFYAA